MKQIDLNPVYETFPLLRFACDEAGERNFSNNWLWSLFLNFRDVDVGVQQPLLPYQYGSANLAWLEFLDGLQDLYGHARTFDSGYPLESAVLFPDPVSNFRAALVWREEWRAAVDEYVPRKYQSFINDQEGVVSVVEDPWKLLHLSKPDPIDNQMWQYRRWLARRDWFLTNIAMLLQAYSSQFEFYDFVIWLDRQLMINGCFHTDAFLEMPVRQLQWENRTIGVYCDWNRKSLGSLLFKVLRKQYDGGETLYENIFDIMRGRFVVSSPEDFQAVNQFIEKFFPEMNLRRDKENFISSDQWRAAYYKGRTHKIKFELQVQLFEDYLDANYGHGEVNHSYYKAKQFFNLIPIMLPPEMLERFFKINWCDFCKEYISFNKKRFEIEE